MKLRSLAAVAVLGFALLGCASIIKGTTQSIAIVTPPVTGADCTLTSDQGSWTVTSPGFAKVQRSKDDMQIRCNKSGYQEAVAMIPSNFEEWTVGNVVFPGPIGVGIDAATGAISQYPHTFQIPMQRESSASN